MLSEISLVQLYFPFSSLINLGMGKNGANFSTTAIGPEPGPPPP